MKCLIIVIIAAFPIASLLMIYKGAKNSGKGILETNYQVLLSNSPKIANVNNYYELESIPNFRSIPSYETKDGKYIRKNLIYRSSVLNKDSEKIKEHLKKIQISTVCDIRSSFENEKIKNNGIDEVKFYNIPVDKECGIIEINGFTTIFRRKYINEYIKKRYVKNVLESAKNYCKALNVLNNDSALPILYVSYYGKDRMGILIVLLLELLGVDRKTIIYDYVLSNKYGKTFYDDFLKKDTVIKRMEINPKEISGLFAADPNWIEAVLNEIDKKYDDVENYLIKKGKMSKEDITKIRNLLLVDNGG